MSTSEEGQSPVAPEQPRQQPDQQVAPQPEVAAPQAQQVAPEGVQTQEGVGEQQAPPPVTAGGDAVPPGAEVPGTDADREPAVDQAPVASEANRAVRGDPGFGEQTPTPSEGGPQSVNTPFGTSMSAPSMQSGMPLAEDRAAAEQESEGESPQAQRPQTQAAQSSQQTEGDC